MTRHLRPFPRFRRGLSYIELMISLAITSALLTAVAAAFTASAGAVEDNDEFVRASQAARMTLNGLVDAVRKSHYCGDVNSDSIHILTVDGDDLTYRFDPATGQLTRISNDGDDTNDHVLARNLKAVKFVGEEVDGVVVRLSIALEVQVGNNRVSLTGSASPRRLLP